MIYRRLAELAIIDSEISRVEDGIVTLVRQRAHLKRKRNTYSPAVNLPPEVLSRIFEFACLPDSGEFASFTDVYQPSRVIPGATNLGVCTGLGAVTPLFLSMICTAWRKNALCASQLWNSITVHLDDKYADLQAALLQHWLERSRRRPLRINVVEDASIDEGEDDTWGLDSTSTSVIDVLVSFSSQWHTVDMFLPSAWKSALTRTRNNLPNLRSLTLRVAEGSPTLSPVDAFALAPRLRDVTLVGYSFSDVVLPCSQLEKLEGEYVNVAESLEMLRLCPSLVGYQFTQQSRGVLPFTSTPVVHDRLESFELILDSVMEYRGMLAALTLPSLKELVLSLSEEEPMLSDVVSLIRRSGCARTLKTLHLVGLMPEEEDLVRCLSQLPELDALLLINPVMTGGKLTERFIRLLTPGLSAEEEGGWVGGMEAEVPEEGLEIDGMDEVVEEGEDGRNKAFLPRLTKFEYRGLVTFSNHSLVRMLACRWRGQGTGTMPEVEVEDPMDYPTPPPSSSSACTFEQASWAPSFDVGVAQLSSVSFTTERLFRFVEDDEKVVQHLREDGMHLDFIRDMC